MQYVAGMQGTCCQKRAVLPKANKPYRVKGLTSSKIIGCYPFFLIRIRCICYLSFIGR